MQRSPRLDALQCVQEGEQVSVLMDADSFLAQSSRNLPGTLLAWHYRSRYEALISFSNAAFYGGELYTIPDREISEARERAIEQRLRKSFGDDDAPQDDY